MNNEQISAAFAFCLMLQHEVGLISTAATGYWEDVGPPLHEGAIYKQVREKGFCRWGSVSQLEHQTAGIAVGGGCEILWRGNLSHDLWLVSSQTKKLYINGIESWSALLSYNGLKNPCGGYGTRRSTKPNLQANAICQWEWTVSTRFLASI